MLGDLELLDEASTHEPLWKGVRSIEPSVSDAAIAFHDPVDPALRLDGDVHVACHLYDEALRPVRSPLAE